MTGTEEPEEGNYFALHKRSLPNIKVIPTPGGKIDLARDGRGLLQIYRLIRSYRPHILHTHTAKAGMLGRFAARLARVPIIIHTYHGHILDGYFSPLKTRAILAIERALAAWTDKIVSVSDAVRNELLAKRIGRADQHIVIQLGLELDPFLRVDGRDDCLRKELGLSSEDAIVGIVARLVRIKRHEIFLEACKQIAVTIPKCHFVLVGDGERRAELEESVRALGLSKRVWFLGWRADLPKIYGGLDVVVLSSRNEGSPVSLIEAMAAGRPVVATRVGGVPDLVEHGVSGLLVPPDDARSLAEAITALLLNPERGLALGAAGRKRVSPAFSVERLIRNVDELYQAMLQQEGHANV